MVSDTVFNDFVVIMFWSAIAIFGLALGLIVLLLIVRLRAIARRKRTHALVTKWRRILTGARDASAGRIARRDTFTILNLWNDFNRVAAPGQGVPPSQLHSVAARLDFESLALTLLRKGDAGDQLVALNFFGYYPAQKAANLLTSFADSPLGELALTARRALVLVNPAEMPGLAAAIAARDDFKPRSVERVLMQIGPAVTSSALAAAALESTGPGRVRTLRYFPLIEPSQARPALAAILQSDESPDVIAAALRALTPISNLETRPLVRRFLFHGVPFVRNAAIGALVSVCDEDDREPLMMLLGDNDSWVRYRAAQTVLEKFAHDDVGDLRRDVADRYARDALTQVLAERSVLEVREFVAQETGAAPSEEVPIGIVRQRPMDALRTGN